MAMIGMDPEAVRRVAARLEAQGGVLNQIVVGVDRLVGEAGDAWPGPDAADFQQWWSGHYRSGLVAAVEGVVAAGQQLDRQVDAQVAASEGGAAGGGASGSGFPRLDQIADAFKESADQWLGPVGYAGMAATFIGSRFAPRDALGRWIRRADLSEVQKQIAAGSGKNFLYKNPAWKVIGEASDRLGKLGFVTGGYDIIQGITRGDGGQTVMGVAGALGAVPGPIGWAATAGGLYGDLVLPTSNEQIDGTFDYAMRQRFGDSYDPANPTSEQAAWATKRYEGAGGFFTSISDGMDYKMDQHGKTLQRWGNGIAGLFGGR